MINENQIASVFEFSDGIVKAKCENFQEILKFSDTFLPKYQEEKEKLPYHINVIDELHADENSHSRIFAQLLRYEKNGKFEYLESFLKDVAKFDLSVKKPKVEKVDSCGRIDIPIFDDDFVLVIENKVTDKALDQNREEGGQLARYIETIKNSYNRDINTVYVIYTPKNTREPSDDCWLSKDGGSYKEEFKGRFCSLSYRDKIYPWIKEIIFPNIDNKDNYLKSALEQYIDYLEGEQMFNIREINKNMNMELQKFIKEKLGIQDNNPEDAVKILSEKEQEFNSVLTQIVSLKAKIQEEIDEKYFSSCYDTLNQLQICGGIVVRKITTNPGYNPLSAGISFVDKNLTVWLGKDDNNGLFCQINTNDKTELGTDNENLFKKIVGNEIFGSSTHRIWKPNLAKEDALNYIKEICKQLTK